MIPEVHQPRSADRHCLCGLRIDITGLRIGIVFRRSADRRINNVQIWVLKCINQGLRIDIVFQCLWIDIIGLRIYIVFQQSADRHCCFNGLRIDMVASTVCGSTWLKNVRSADRHCVFNGLRIDVVVSTVCASTWFKMCGLRIDMVVSTVCGSTWF